MKNRVSVAQSTDVHGGAMAGGVTIEQIIVKQFMHLGFEGTLELTFYNDRLVSARFTPTDVARYKVALGKHYDHHFESSRDVSLPPSTTVWFTESKRSGSFAGWEDHALISQFDVYQEN